MDEYLHLRRVVLADLKLCEIFEEEAREALGALDAQYGFVGPHKEGLLSYLLHEHPDLLMNEEMEFAHAQHRIRVQNGCESACVYFRGKAHQECERCFQGDVSFSQEACPVCREELEPA